MATLYQHCLRSNPVMLNGFQVGPISTRNNREAQYLDFRRQRPFQGEYKRPLQPWVLRLVEFTAHLRLGHCFDQQ